MKKNKLVGYLGPDGTFTHEAVLKIMDNNADINPFNTILQVFEALDEGIVDEAVVPMENSTEGSVVLTLDALTYFDIKIRSEILLPIKQNLLVQRGRSLDDITVICSHPQAIAQCRHYINKINKPVHAMSSTANAARYVSELSTAAVIGSEILSKKYNLDILDSSIQDYDNNMTRFVVLARQNQSKSTGRDKTSIVISLHDDKPGGLYEILSIFAKYNVNLTKIESRPSKQGIGKYIFFIDVEGHITDTSIKDSTDEIKEKVDMFKLLGSYNIINVGGS